MGSPALSTTRERAQQAGGGSVIFLASRGCLHGYIETFNLIARDGVSRETMLSAAFASLESGPYVMIYAGNIQGALVEGDDRRWIMRFGFIAAAGTLLSTSSPVFAQSAPYWMGRDIAATAREIPVVKLEARDEARERSGDRDRRRGRDRRSLDWIYVGPPVTVGVGSLEPRDSRSTYHLDQSRPDWDEQKAKACSSKSLGPASASSAIASAAHADGERRC